MKTIKIALLLLFTFTGIAGMAQKKDKNHRLEIADSILTVKLELTDAEQKAFLPMFHEFVKAKKANRKKYLPSERKGRKKMEDLTDAELNEVLIKRFEFKESDLKLKREYHEKFKTVLPIKKLAKFYHIEKRLFVKGKKRKKIREKRKGEKPARPTLEK